MNIKLLSNFSIVFVAAIALMVFSSSVLIPLAFAILIAFLLYPPSKFLENKLPRMLSAVIVFSISLFIIGIIILSFGFLLKDVVSGMKDFDISLDKFVNDCCSWISQSFGVNNKILIEKMESNAAQFLKGPFIFFTNQLSTGATFLFSVMITFILSFLLVIYRTAFKNFIITQIPAKEREEVKKVLSDVQKVSQKYLLGLFLVMGILGILNSLGLWAIGVKHPLFWGFFAALLTIVPYVGTFIGGFMPFLYAIITTSTIWQPAAIVVLFLFVQFLEDNFIKPKVVGKQVDLNPFFAILALLIGGIIWGVPGFVLALPYVAILKIVFEHFDETQSIAELMGSDIYNKQDVFMKEYSQKKYSIFNIFKRRK